MPNSLSKSEMTEGSMKPVQLYTFSTFSEPPVVFFGTAGLPDGLGLCAGGKFESLEHPAIISATHAPRYAVRGKRTGNLLLCACLRAKFASDYSRVWREFAHDPAPAGSRVKSPRLKRWASRARLQLQLETNRAQRRKAPGDGERRATMS